MKTIINDKLLYEYDLHPTAYRLLDLARSGPISWASPDHYAELKQISGNPAVPIRKLIDRGLLDGPNRSQKIHQELIILTPSGLDTLLRIERGLHQPGWITAARSRVLALMLSNGGNMIRSDYAKDGISLTTLRSLAKHGYIKCITNIQWRITDLGREAWKEYKAEKENG